MEPAFADFREPHAWLIRGLVEYGWPDVTRVGGRVPPGSFGGFSLASFSSTGGRAGITLNVPAVADGQWFQDDGVYEFVARLTRDDSGRLAFAVRCAEANFLQLFVFEDSNPVYVAGFIHQALTGYVPDFVRWRQGGGEITWAQRAGLPEIPGEPCSTMLSQFVGARVSARQSLDTGPAEGWWLGGAGGGGGASMPVIAQLGQAAENELRAGGMNSASRAMIEQSVKGPAGALLFFGSAGVMQGGLWLLNILITLGLYGGGMLRRPLGDYLLSVIFSTGLGLVLLLGGAAAVAGGRRYMQLKGGVLPWVSMAYAVLLPGCCLFGLPTALWAAYVWRRPEVRAITAES